jgi:hypothetical protein
MSLPAEISGKEAPAGDGSALDALIDFYRSFNASDLNALASGLVVAVQSQQGSLPCVAKPTPR